MRLINKITEALNKAKQKSAEFIESPDAIYFRGLYDQAMLQGQDRRVETDGFHPSHLGIKSGNCMRRAVYLLRGVEKVSNFDPRTMRIFANGHGVHERIQSKLDKIFGDNFESELEVCWDHPQLGTPVRGHADGLLVLPEGFAGAGRRIIIEIKSCSENAYSMRLEYKKAKVAHFAQANIYAYTLDCDSIWFIYENKNTQEFIIFDQEADPDMARKQIAKWGKAWKIHQRNELPVRPYKMESEACLECDMRDMCWASQELGVKL